MPYPLAAIRDRNFGQVTAFAGAYDAIPSITAAYGMRRLLTSYTGSILRIRRSSDNAEQDIGYVANGDLDTAAVSTFIGGGSGYIVDWYDQSGNGYTAAQTTAAVGRCKRLGDCGHGSWTFPARECDSTRHSRRIA